MVLHFKQSCPVCGRRLEVPTRLLGQTIACQHCCAEFRSGDEAAQSGRGSLADELLARVDAALARHPHPPLRRATLPASDLSVSPSMGSAQ